MKRRTVVGTVIGGSIGLVLNGLQVPTWAILALALGVNIFIWGFIILMRLTIRRATRRAMRYAEVNVERFVLVEQEIQDYVRPLVCQDLGLEETDYVWNGFNLSSNGACGLTQFVPVGRIVFGFTVIHHYETHVTMYRYDNLIASYLKHKSYTDTVANFIAHELRHVKQIKDGELKMGMVSNVQADRNKWFEKQARAYGKAFVKEHQEALRQIASKYSL